MNSPPRNGTELGKSERTRIAIVGCGSVCEKYIVGMRGSPGIELAGVFDVDASKSEELATRHGVQVLRDIDEVTLRAEIDLFVNLTPPTEHYATTRVALERGKHVFSEKPLALEPESAWMLVDLARDRGRLLAAAPDTFLAAPFRRAAELLAAGEIGVPVTFVGAMTCGGHEKWHPRPHFYYQPGGGPLFDLAPYHLTLLIELLGPIAAVQASSRMPLRTRRFIDKHGECATIPVSVATHYIVMIEMASGATGTLMVSYDIPIHHLPDFEIYGTEGVLQLPSPDDYGGEFRVFREVTGCWESETVASSFPKRSRGLGIHDMVAALHEGRPPIASGERGAMLVQVIDAIDTACRSRRRVPLGRV